MSRFIVMDRAARVPSSWKWGNRNYRKIAVVETDLPEGEEPSRLDERDKHVLRICQLWTPVYHGSTERSQYGRALAEAEKLAGELGRVS